jgi:hypothetical protein
VVVFNEENVVNLLESSPPPCLKVWMEEYLG